ncbi:MAG: AbrB/MazE/SpoVT family DNA-binding domain-containing protein [Clostridia bacterium]|nr:MAG: AbrB/MazE/SpoVT family DNA-binding domain-containing protein [Clostridia bacterium]
MEPRVQKWGNSLGIRIPKPLAQQLGLTEGTPVEVEADNHRIVIRRKRYTLEELLSKVTPENLHGEVDMGLPMGREEW